MTTFVEGGGKWRFRRDVLVSHECKQPSNEIKEYFESRGGEMVGTPPESVVSVNFV